MKRRLAMLALVAVSTPVVAQWLTLPTPESRARQTARPISPRPRRALRTAIPICRACGIPST